MAKYIKLTWPNGRTLIMPLATYEKNKEYWDRQQCIKEMIDKL